MENKETKTKKTAAKTKKPTVKKQTTKKVVKKTKAVKKDTVKVEEVKVIEPIKEEVKEEKVTETKEEVKPTTNVENKEVTKPIKCECLPCKKIAIITSLVALALLIIVGFSKIQISKKYKLANILGCFEESTETITLPGYYFVGNDGSIFKQGENDLLELVGGISCFTGTIDDYNALLEDTKLDFEDIEEFETNGYNAFRLTYNYYELEYQILFMYKDGNLLQMTFTELDAEQAKKIATSIK